MLINFTTVPSPESNADFLRDPRQQCPWFETYGAHKTGQVYALKNFTGSALYWDAGRIEWAGNINHVPLAGETVEIHGFGWTVGGVA